MSARVRFEPSGVAVQVAPGERVLDAVDEHPQVGLPLACRAGNCGACLVAVVPGAAAALALPGTRERETLAALGAGGDLRLACQLRIVATTPSAGTELVLHVVAARAAPASSGGE